MSDVKRQLSKLHLAVGSQADPRVKLFAKLDAYTRSDANTPILGNLAERAAELAENEPKLTTKAKRQLSNLDNAGLIPWLSEVAIAEQYPNHDDGWMWHAVEASFENSDVDKLFGWLASCNTYADLLKPPLVATVKELVPVPGIIESRSLPATGSFAVGEVVAKLGVQPNLAKARATASSHPSASKAKSPAQLKFNRANIWCRDGPKCSRMDCAYKHATPIVEGAITKAGRIFTKLDSASLAKVRANLPCYNPPPCKVHECPYKHIMVVPPKVNAAAPKAAANQK
jgi:hypothetical protein